MAEAATEFLVQPSPSRTLLSDAFPHCQDFLGTVPPLTLVMCVVVVVLVVSDVIVWALISTPGSRSAPGST